MVRDRDEPGPWVPGLAARFAWVPPDHPDEKRIRHSIQDNGKNLYVLSLPGKIAGTEVKVLAVGFYPDELHSASWSICDPRQKADWMMGRMIVLKTLQLSGFFEIGNGELGSVWAYLHELEDVELTEIKKNNRNARSRLKRKTTASYLELEMNNAIEEREEKIIAESDFVNAYVEAYEDSEHTVKGNPRVSQHIGGVN